MRFACRQDRLCLVHPAGMIDVEAASAGRFPSDPTAAYEQWPRMLAWARTLELDEVDRHDYEADELQAPSPRPRQVFAVGLNYRAHAIEAGFDIPEFPTVFTKFPTCITGPECLVSLPSEYVDWEAELVAVVGQRAHNVASGDGWSYVAGLTAGQDLSERRVQHRQPSPQWCLGKSYPRFGPTGPHLVTPDEFVDPDAVSLRTIRNGVVMQAANTADLIFPVPVLVELLSTIVVLLPGDLIFTGTPAGVGHARDPELFLQPGDLLVTEIDNVGSLKQRFVPDARHSRSQRTRQ